MKKLSILASYILISVLFYSCMKDEVTRTYTIFEPIYKSKTEVYANIKTNPARAVENPGKIFLYGNYIFLNEVDKGVHIIDNSDPANPVIKGFIEIPGNLDIAVKGNTLYADLYRDLVVIDISNPMQTSFIKYIPEVFPGRSYSYGFILADSSKIIVGWNKRDTTVRLDYDPRKRRNRDVIFLSAGSAASAGVVPATGIAGSMARFALVNNYLYAVNSQQLLSFNINNTNDPQKVATNYIGWNIETIYPFKNKLFIGSMSGMFIYDITNPAYPGYTGQFNHARACDPVISDGNYAYVTLHDGTPCQGTDNQLDVIDVSNLSAPSLLKTYQMTNPHGLAKDNDLLFICDGRGGLKMYNTADPSNIILKKHIVGVETYDAIAWNNDLIVVAKDGLYQYDYSNPTTLVQRSKISVHR
jgi:hypothetical protein